MSKGQRASCIFSDNSNLDAPQAARRVRLAECRSEVRIVARTIAHTVAAQRDKNLDFLTLKQNEPRPK